MQSPVIFKPESNIEVVLQTSAEEKLKLSGKKKWFIPINNPYKEMGIEITNPSLKYKKFVETQIQIFRSKQ